MINCDLLVIGGGIAGLSAALTASRSGQKVIILTKGRVGESATEKAQGGIAAAIDEIRDSTEFHFQDTLAAGGGLCDEGAVRVLVNEGVERVKELIEMGARFDRAETEAGGGFALALEGAHKRRRILHAGDATGREIERTLGWKLLAEGKVEFHTLTAGIELLLSDGRCCGAAALNQTTNEIVTYLAKNVILATGGIGQVYLYTTNPEFASGDGIAMAYRAGATITDLEFVQFHPTAMVQFKQFEDIIALPRFLISEAVRGEGGILLNNRGKRFIHELSARDIVARAIFEEMKKTNDDHVFLSLKQISPETIKHRFPVIYATCLERGLDITKDNIPVAPAAHYFMGGIKTDLNGRTNISGLMAAGECASTGVHGANRLASNSLLEGLVFGHRAALAATRENPNSKQQKTTRAEASRCEANNIQIQNIKTSTLKDHEIKRLKLIVKTAMWNETGIIRQEAGLKDALEKIKKAENGLDQMELKNMALIARLITQAALDRTESRGAHYRSDHPKTDDKNWRRHLTYSRQP